MSGLLFSLVWLAVFKLGLRLLESGLGFISRIAAGVVVHSKKKNTIKIAKKATMNHNGPTEQVWCNHLVKQTASW